VNPVAEERLPHSIGGLTDLALAAYATRFPLYAALAAFSLALQAAAEWTFPSRTDALNVASIVGDALVVAAVAIGVARYAANCAHPDDRVREAAATEPDETADAPLLQAALRRWFSAAGALTIAWLIFATTYPASGFVAPAEPGAAMLMVLSAPATWLVWAAVALAAPLASILPDSPALAIFTGFARSIMLALRVRNLGRLCVLAFATIVPLLLEIVLTDVFQRRELPHAAFWANTPADAIVTGPLAALQTVFALDFTRRANGR